MKKEKRHKFFTHLRERLRLLNQTKLQKTSGFIMSTKKRDEIAYFTTKGL